MLPMAVARTYYGGVTQSQREEAILGVFFLTDIALYGPYSGMNFAMKDRLASIYLFTVKLARIQFQILKWHNCDYFEINRKETNTGMEKFDD